MANTNAVNDLTDMKIDLKTGFVYIDDETNDAVIIRGSDVILQDTAIRLQTQIGTVKRQELDGFGWNKLGHLKQKWSVGNIEGVITRIKKIIMQDDRIDDAEVGVIEDPQNEDLQITGNILIGEITLPLSVTI